MRSIITALHIFVFLMLASGAAEAALINISVQGTWNSLAVTGNPFGLTTADTFLFEAAYNDNLLFKSGLDNLVTASLDPTVTDNAGAFFRVTIPHPVGAPNPLIFEHGDHITIPSLTAPTAEIEFDGTDVSTDPGVFRSFEFSTEFLFGTVTMGFDAFLNGQPQSQISDISAGFVPVLVGFGTAGHLEVIPEPSTAALVGLLSVAGLMRRRARG